MKKLRRLFFGSGGKSASASDTDARVVVFDFDGTIADTFSVAVEIFKFLKRKFRILMQMSSFDENILSDLRSDFFYFIF